MVSIAAVATLALLATRTDQSHKSTPAAGQAATGPVDDSGALSLLPGKSTCIEDPIAPVKSCGTVTPGLYGAMTAAVSPDGRFVYVTSFQASTLTIFARDRKSGKLEPKGCVKDPQAPGAPTCASSATGLAGAMSVVMSPDGKDLYVASIDSRSVTAFSRDAKTGAVTPLAGGACIEDVSSGPLASCSRVGNGLSGVRWVTMSPDGRNVYTAASAGHAIAVFRRNPATGVLTQLPGAQACIEDVDFYLVDLRRAKLDPDQLEHVRRCGAILEDRAMKWPNDED